VLSVGLEPWDGSLAKASAVIARWLNAAHFVFENVVFWEHQRRRNDSAILSKEPSDFARASFAMTKKLGWCIRESTRCRP
jgi:hypothetical protein